MTYDDKIAFRETYKAVKEQKTFIENNLKQSFADVLENRCS